jgi:hypothetical protein
MKKLSIVLSALLLTIAFSCNDNSNLTKQNEIKVDDKGIATLISYIDFNVNHLASSGFKDYGNQEALTKIVANSSATFEKQYGVSIIADSKNARSSSDQLEYTTRMDSEVAQKLLEFSKTSANEDDYLSKLAGLKTEVYTYNVSAAEKQMLMTKVVFIERFIKYLDVKAESATLTKGVKFNANAKEDANAPACKTWWCSWGKCAAGIIGTAGATAWGFGMVGAGAGTVALPVIGTVSVGAVGAVVGAVTGGLIGASQSCD